MATSLREFLSQKSAIYAAESEKNQILIEEWQGAVDKLFIQLHQWLTAVDPERIIRLEYGQIEVTEPIGVVLAQADIAEDDVDQPVLR